MTSNKMTYGMQVLFALDRLSQTGDEVQTMVYPCNVVWHYTCYCLKEFIKLLVSQIQSGAYPGLVGVVESEGIDALAKAEIQGILDELSSRESDAR